MYTCLSVKLQKLEQVDRFVTHLPYINVASVVLTLSVAKCDSHFVVFSLPACKCWLERSNGPPIICRFTARRIYPSTLHNLGIWCGIVQKHVYVVRSFLYSFMFVASFSNFTIDISFASFSRKRCCGKCRDLLQAFNCRDWGVLQVQSTWWSTSVSMWSLLLLYVADTNYIGMYMVLDIKDAMAC